MRDYNYIDDVEVLKDNILDEDCKIKQKIILSILYAANLLT